MSDPTASTAIARESSSDMLWITTIDESLRAVGKDVRQLAFELWVHPTLHPGTNRRHEKIAGKLHITQSQFYSWRKSFVLEVGSRALARGLIKEK